MGIKNTIACYNPTPAPVLSNTPKHNPVPSNASSLGGTMLILGERRLKTWNPTTKQFDVVVRQAERVTKQFRFPAYRLL